jgi:hypothetical protein
MTENVKKHEVQMIDSSLFYFILASIYSPTNPMYVGTPNTSNIDHPYLITHSVLHEDMPFSINPGIIATHAMGAI